LPFSSPHKYAPLASNWHPPAWMVYHVFSLELSNQTPLGVRF
jgi:hypothetical protein